MPVVKGRLCAVRDETALSHRAITSLVLNEKDGSVLVAVPRGEFVIGDGRERNCPKHRVQLDAYYVGMYCVTNRQYERFVRETDHRVPEIAEWGKGAWVDGRCAEKKLDHPVTYVSWDDAITYAQWAGCGLPTEAQWESAARGPRGLIFPWGNEWGVGPSHGLPLGNRLAARDGQALGTEETSPVWSHGAGVSGYGSYQQSGNVWEWCADWYDEHQPERLALNPCGPAKGLHRVARGGSWRDLAKSSFRCARREKYEPSHRFGSLGFRLARRA